MQNFKYFLAVSLLAPSLVFAQVPRIIDLGPEPGLPSAISNNGTIVGGRYLYRRESGWQLVAGTPSDLLEGIRRSISDVNDSGSFVGGIGYPLDGPGSVFCPGHGDAFLDTTAPFQPFDGLAAISDNGNLAGDCDQECNYFDACARINGQIVRLGPSVPNVQSSAVAVNDAGEVLLSVATYNDQGAGPVLYDVYRSSPDSSLTLIKESTVGVRGSSMNAAGTVLGAEGFRLGGNNFATSPFLARKDGTLIELPGYLGPDTDGIQPAKLNAAEEFVGYAQVGQTTIGFRYSAANGYEDLNSLLPPDSRYTISRASAINDAGEIVGGMGDQTPNGAAFLLTTRPNTALDPSFTADHVADRAIYRPAEGNWYILPTSDAGSVDAIVRHWGLPGDVPVRGDFDGDGVLDLVSFRPSTGVWWTCPSHSDFDCSNGTGVKFGLPGDLPVSGDFDGDGISDRAVFRAFYTTGSGKKKVTIEGHWYLDLSTGTQKDVQWGLRDDLPVPEDYDGDGRTDIAVFRQSTGTWYLLSSAKGYSTAPADVTVVQFGLPGDHPMPADYDGDGRADLAVWRPSTGEWFVCGSIHNYDCAPNQFVGARFTQTQFGLPGDTPVRGDFDGDQTFDFAVWRENVSGILGTWYTNSPSRTSAAALQWGLPGDLPVGLGVKRLRELLPRNGDG